MKIERVPSYRPEGNPERVKKALERKKALDEGRLPQWEKENPDFVLKIKSEQISKKDHMKGNAEEVKRRHDALMKLYPPKPGQTPSENSM